MLTPSNCKDREIRKLIAKNFSSQKFTVIDLIWKYAVT